MGSPINWQLVNPEGAVAAAGSFLFQRRPESLDGKTVLLRWNGKHNGDVFLNRIGELIARNSRDVRVVRAWEVAPETMAISYNSGRSQSFTDMQAALKPDLVIGSTGD